MTEPTDPTGPTGPSDLAAPLNPNTAGSSKEDEYPSTPAAAYASDHEEIDPDTIVGDIVKSVSAVAV